MAKYKLQEYLSKIRNR